MKKTTMTLVRGIPGSGKSTLAKDICDYTRAVHLEADMYFVHDSAYLFDPKWIGAAHDWCKKAADIQLTNGHSVVVSNTFTTIKELRPYFEIALEHGIIPSVVLLQNDYGSIHDVPDETITKMKQRFVYDISSLISEFKDRFDFESKETV